MIQRLAFKVKYRSPQTRIERKGEAAVATFVLMLVGMLLLPTPATLFSCYEMCTDKGGKISFPLAVCHF